MIDRQPSAEQFLQYISQYQQNIEGEFLVLLVK